MILPAFALVGCGGSRSETAAIEQAVRAPLIAYMGDQVGALCGSFTPTVAAGLTPRSTSCSAGVARAIAAMRNTAIGFARGELPQNLKITIVQHGDTAKATTTWPWHEGAVRLELVKQDGGWRIASRTTLVEDVVCGVVLFQEDTCAASFSIVFGPTPARVVRQIHAKRIIEEARPDGTVWRREK